MNPESLHIRGMPYFPGLVRGGLQYGFDGDVDEAIVIIDQQATHAPERLPAGLIVVDCAPFSHHMIGLLGLGVPTVLITSEQAALLDAEQDWLIDGGSGLVTNELGNGPDLKPVEYALYPDQQAVMSDGEPVILCASVRHPEAAGQALAVGARSIGLVRSEFLQPEDGSLPDKAFYLERFGAIAEAANGLSISVRLLDIATDKLPSWLPRSENLGRSLGLQGTRLYGTEPVRGVIEAQLAALSELSKTYSLRVIVPFIVRLEEFEYWLAWVREQLPDTISVGAMAETPASVLDIHHLSEVADFIAIGCNDLMQSVFAADRDIAELRHYLDPYAPVLYRLFRQIAEQAGDHLADVQLCGLLPQLQGVLPVLLGLGYRCYSVDAPFIPHLASVASELSQAECEDLAAHVCDAHTTQEVLEVLQLHDDRHPPFLF